MSGQRRCLCAEDHVSGPSPSPSTEVQTRCLLDSPTRMSHRFRYEMTTKPNS